jgi:hypothetical protein
MRNPLWSVELGFSGLADIRIPFDFMADRGFGAMARQDASRRVEWKDFFTNAIEEERTIAARQIPATYALMEKNIPRHKQTVFGKIKTQTPRAMAWHMEAQDFEPGNRFGFAFFEKQIRLAGLVLNVESMLLEKSPVSQHGNGIRMKSDAATMATLDFCGVHHMVEMSMGQKQPIDLLPSKIIVGALEAEI